jgi:hypothetical protein
MEQEIGNREQGHKGLEGAGIKGSMAEGGNGGDR